MNNRLEQRSTDQLLRQLDYVEGCVDLCSNDYLGLGKRKLRPLTRGDGDPVFSAVIDRRERWHGSTGSRLISGNYPLIEALERELAAFHAAGAGLVFNSGYDANLGLLSSVPQRGDTVLYDQLSHASIKDGIRLSFARAHPFLHNDVDDLEKKLKKASGNVFVVTETIFSMDGDIAPLVNLAACCERYGALLIVDEAHATGVVGKRGEGLVQALGLEKKCFARIHTFGKALACHGAIVVGSATLRNYLVNFSRPFIYTTALPASAVAAVGAAYREMQEMTEEREKLTSLIRLFRTRARHLQLTGSDTPIQGVIFSGNASVREKAAHCRKHGFDVRPILSPTVPKGKERLRVILHAFNTPEEIEGITGIL